MPHLTGRQWLLAVGGLVMLLLTVAGAYGLLTGPSASNAHTEASSTAVRVVEPSPPNVQRPALEERTPPKTNDPIQYARAVATTLFSWDTASGYMPADYVSAVLADADPSGEETAGLISDVTAYVPTVDQWLDLATMDVAQSLEVQSAAVPTSWATALDEDHGNLRPGTVGVTITGIRHRSGIWQGEPANASYPVSFTVFVACPPAFKRCYLLRLSKLDHPMR